MSLTCTALLRQDHEYHCVRVQGARHAEVSQVYDWACLVSLLFNPSTAALLFNPSMAILLFNPSEAALLFNPSTAITL